MNAWLQVWRWPWEPQVAAAVLALGWVYAVGLSRNVGSVTPLLWARAASYYAALAALVIALQSPVDAFSDRSFAWHMVQHLLLLLVVPPLVVMAAPWPALRAGLPWRRLRHGPLPIPGRWRALSRLPVVRALGHPWAALAAFVVYLWGTHLPVVFDLTLRQQLVHDTEHLGYLAVGMWLWSRLVPSPPLPEPPPLRRRLELVAGAVAACWVLGITLTMTRSPLYTAYLDVPGATVPSVVASLQDGGAIMWAPSMMPFNIWLFATLSRWLAGGARTDRRAAGGAGPERVLSS